jgi:sugar phosphate permease
LLLRLNTVWSSGRALKRGRRPDLISVRAVGTAPRYRWLVLSAGTAAQTSYSAVSIGLPVLAPAFRDAFDLSLFQVGIVLDSVWIGATLTLLPWGLVADRVGERRVLAIGLAGCAAALAGAAETGSFPLLLVLLAVAGAAGASVNSASGRAVMQWFAARERGLALGVRQTAIPLGGFIAAFALPALGLKHALLFLAAFCLAGAVIGLALLRERAVRDDPEAAEIGSALREPRLWRLCFGSSLYLVAQLAVLGFVVLFLHDARGLSDSAAAAVLGGVQVLAAAFRIGAGRWSDIVGSRLMPLLVVGAVSSVTLGLVAALVHAPLALLIAGLVVAGGFGMAWNGLSFTTAAEIAGARHSGAALGLQQTALSIGGALFPPTFAALVATTSWRTGFAVAAAFPLVGVLVLRPLRGAG